MVTARDLAKLYACVNGTKTINQAVRRHTERFPEDFYFQLPEEEYYNILRSQTGTLERIQGQYAKYLPTLEKSLKELNKENKVAHEVK